MNGTTQARTPTKLKRLSSFLNAPMALTPVFLPIAISVIIKVKPKVTASIKYTSRKMPPPYFAAR